MITELERRLSEAFHEDAQRARLVNPDHPEERASWRRADAQGRASGRIWLGAVAAATLLAVVAGIAMIQNARDGEPAPIAPSPSAPNPSTPTTTPPTTAPLTTTPPTTIATGPTQLFTDIPPDSTMTLPPAPIDAREIGAAVWTGTEIIVWGGNDPRSHASVDDGAAFNMATGTWRMIAPAPIEARGFAHVAWTGTEMIVWGGLQRDGTVVGGSYNQTELADGAAYNPDTDTWRRLPEAPIDYYAGYSNAVWTGDEVIVLGGGQGNQAAAYNPATNQWRRLADVPGHELAVDEWGRPIWTGTSILTTIGPWLARYDPTADTWQLGDEARYAALVGIPDDDGVTRTVIALPSVTGAPVEVLDDTGTLVGQLPGHPGDVDVFGDRIEADGIWLGDEAVFHIMGANWGLIGDSAYLVVDDHTVDVSDVPVAWALNPATQTWRTLEERVDGFTELAIGDLLFAWRPESPGGAVAAATLYRSPTTAAG
jgi:hypothetical protein